MKKNHAQVESLILKAIAACGNDSVFSDTKMYLGAALQSANKVSQSRNRSTANEAANKAGKAKYDQWWEMLKKNAADNFKAENINYEENL